jgi:hypothetical protein
MFGQEGDVDHVVLARAALDIEPPDGFAGANNREPIGAGIVALIIGVLRPELHGQERRFLIVGPRYRREFLGAGRGIDPIQERQIGVPDRPKAQARFGGAPPAE